MVRAIFNRTSKSSGKTDALIAPPSTLGKAWTVASNVVSTVRSGLVKLCILAVAVPLWLAIDVILWGTVNFSLLIVSKAQRNALSRWLREPEVRSVETGNGEVATELIFPRQWEIKDDYLKEMKQHIGDAEYTSVEDHIDDALCYTDLETRNLIREAVKKLAKNNPSYMELQETAKFIRHDDRMVLLKALKPVEKEIDSRVIASLKENSLWEGYKWYSGRDATSKIVVRVPGQWSIPKYGYIERFFYACRGKPLIRNKLVRTDTQNGEIPKINQGVKVCVADQRKLSSSFNLIGPFVKFGSQTDLTLSDSKAMT
jgi:hypothetical protein